MVSTELLLYLVSVAFIIFIVMYYMREDKHDYPRFYPPPPPSQPTTLEQDTANNQTTQASQYHNTYCRQRGKCTCGLRNINVNVNNDDASFGGYPPPMMGGPGPVPPVDPLRKFDYDAMYDEFTPPFRRSYYDLYNYMLGPGLYPSYTRGPPGRFRKIGTLMAQDVGYDDKFKFLLLIGREKYPGREYEYYVTMPNTHDKLKIYIDTRGKEILDGDTVIVPEMQGYKYIFREDKDLSPKYDPYFI